MINQIEINPFLYRKNTIAFFHEEGIQLQSYRAMRQAKEFGNAKITAIAQKHGKAASQVRQARMQLAIMSPC